MLAQLLPMYYHVLGLHIWAPAQFCNYNHYFVNVACRFWVLETVARIPYMAYISILHLYETIGFWRAGAELRKVHFAEEWNEMHHCK